MDDDIYFVCRRARWGTPWPSRCTALSLTGSCSGPITLCSTTRTWRTSQRWNLSIPRGRSESQGFPPRPQPAPAWMHVHLCVRVSETFGQMALNSLSAHVTPPLPSGPVPPCVLTCVLFSLGTDVMLITSMWVDAVCAWYQAYCSSLPIRQIMILYLLWAAKEK